MRSPTVLPLACPSAATSKARQLLIPLWSHDTPVVAAIGRPMRCPSVAGRSTTSSHDRPEARSNAHPPPDHPHPFRFPPPTPAAPPAVSPIPTTDHGPSTAAQRPDSASAPDSGSGSSFSIDTSPPIPHHLPTTGVPGGRTGLRVCPADNPPNLTRVIPPEEDRLTALSRRAA